MIIGTAGHIDHGKTALVKALTGIDADRLPEEKRRGITIDLGYAYTDTPNGTLGFVDVPGHERFVHTMLAGASGIDAALFVVALDDGVMPQTREHAHILQLLGIARGVVALTKADLARGRVVEVAAQVRSLLADTGLGAMPLLPVSAVTGEGIEALRAALLALGPRPRDSDGFPRLAVDRAFRLAGAGLVVTGTLVAGRVRVDDRLMLSPPGLELRVRGLHAQNRQAEQAVAGQRVALNITGPRLSKDSVARGDWVLHPDVHAPTFRLDARLRLLAQEARPLRVDAPVHLHLGAAHVMARVAPLDIARISPGDTALARLTLDHPIGALALDRLVLRDATATRTIGGGVVIDPFPPRRGRRTAERLGQLAALGQPDTATALRGLLALAPKWTDAATFFRSRNVAQVVRATVMTAAPAVAMAELLMAPAALEALRTGVVDRLAAHHAASPDQPGLQPERLRQATPGRPSPTAFRAIIEFAGRARSGRAGRPMAAAADPPRHSVTAGRTHLAGCTAADLRGALPTTAHARPGASIGRAGTGDARHAEAVAAHGQTDRGRAGSVLPERNGGRACRYRRCDRGRRAGRNAHRRGVPRPPGQWPEGRDPDPGILRPRGRDCANRR